ncbi:murein biosynthesis integral membrane protein MurJ [Marichromatium sp. AB32]|uniref:murein biosynthesis integral membrane protein MurJ n=1 Tax=Marichromatium sp. AB32 TaxID=2483363 RepID=UPI000F3CC689|nr:murein biosynthesis integral membrane protein MurJ [Marichromatium sp. AB32]RNE94013.1 murein biosynthesis integral membrane protein MurJ [Marichromatium sp. AB32]
MSSLSGSALVVGGNTLLSRILGFVRDLVIARAFGADATTDAFFVAFKIPNFLRRLFAEGAFAAALVPALEERRRHGGRAGLTRLVDELAGTLGLLLVLFTALGTLVAPLLILLFAPGFGADTDQLALAAELLRLTLPYVLLISLTALAGAVLNCHERFAVPAFTPVLLNLALIGAALLLAPRLERPVLALAWGVLLGGTAQLALQLPALARLGLLPRPRLALDSPVVRRILRRLGPALLGVSVVQLSLLLDTLLASFLTPGSISWLYYAERLMEFPLGLLAAALGVVILPRLTRGSGAASARRFSATLDWGLRWTLLLGLPAAVGLAVLAEGLIATLFQSGAFGDTDVTHAARALSAYALGLLAFIAIKVLAPGCYARHDTRTPVRIALIALGINLVLDLALMGPLGHAGLALATTLAALLNALLLLRALRRDGSYRPRPGWPALGAAVLGASLAMAGMLHWALGTLDWGALAPWDRAWHLGGAILAGATLYAALVLLAGVRPRHLAAPERRR